MCRVEAASLENLVIKHTHINSLYSVFNIIIIIIVIIKAYVKPNKGTFAVKKLFCRYTDTYRRIMDNNFKISSMTVSYIYIYHKEYITKFDINSTFFFKF